MGVRAEGKHSGAVEASALLLQPSVLPATPLLHNSAWMMTLSFRACGSASHCKVFMCVSFPVVGNIVVVILCACASTLKSVKCK